MKKKIRKRKRKEEGLIVKTETIEKKRKDERKMIILILRLTWNSQSNTIYECKSIWVSYQKYNKMAKRVSF